MQLAYAPRLRLVQNVRDIQQALSAADTVCGMGSRLKSAQAVQKSVYAVALLDLLSSLRSDEALLCQHTLNGGADPTQAKRYDFSVIANSAPPDQADFAERVACDLALACPAMHFVQVPMADTNESACFRHGWRLALAPVVVTTRPQLACYGARADTLPLYLPFPADLPGSALGCLLADNQGEMPDCRVSVRFGSFALSESDCVAWLKTKRLLDAGMLNAYHPQSPYHADFSADVGLRDRAATLLDAWLKQPTRGYGFDCIVQAGEDLSNAQLQRIARNVFGDRPFTMAPTNVDILAAIPKFEFFESVKPGQGLPAFLPDLTRVSAFGIAEHFSVPAKRPPATGGSVIGTTVCGAASTLVALPDHDRFSHACVFGASGSGKSSYLLRLIEQDLAHAARPGLVLIDPHGSLFSDVLQLIPKSRAKDVVVVDVTDPHFVSSINPLDGMAQDAQYANFISNEIVELIKILFENKDSAGPTMRSHIKNALLLTQYMRGRASCFLDAARIFEDKDFRDYLLSKCDDRKVTGYWRDFAATNGSDHGFAAWLPYIQARLSPFCDSPLMRRMINSPTSTVDLNACVREGKIVLFNLSTAALGSTEARIVGNLMMNKIFYAAMRRGQLPAARLRPFHMVVDEAATMVSESTTRLFAEARKFGLSLTLATQSVAQLRNTAGEATIAQALLANTATKVMFRLSPSDASLLEPYAEPEFTTKALTRLPVFHATVSMQAHGHILPPFVCRVERPQHSPAQHALVKDVVTASQAVNSRPLNEVVAELAVLYDIPESSLRTANDGPAPDLFSAAGIPLALSRTATFDRFASLMEDAMGFVLGWRWAFNAENVQDKVVFAKYFDADAVHVPEFSVVCDRVSADNALDNTLRQQVLKALDTMRPHLWSEPETAQAVNV